MCAIVTLRVLHFFSYVGHGQSAETPPNHRPAQAELEQQRFTYQNILLNPLRISFTLDKSPHRTSDYTLQKSHDFGRPLNTPAQSKTFQSSDPLGHF